MTLQLLYQGTAPKRAYADDAGLDLTAHGTWLIEPGRSANIDLGVKIKSPPGHWVLLTGRSSTIKRGLHLPVGVIDPGYVGPLFGVAINLTGKPITVNDGERICQLIVMQNSTEAVELVPVERMPDTARGSNGFGSTGL